MANRHFWYPRHFDDYAEKTAHLSLVEHGALTLLLDHYYKTGGKLKADPMAIARICRCQDDSERAAAQSVIDQFFILNEDGMYRNNRADKELQLAANLSTTRSMAGKTGAVKRWRNNEAEANAMANAMASPLANDQQTDAQIQLQIHKNNMSDQPDADQILAYLNEKTGRQYQPVSANMSLIAARLKEGATSDQCKRVIDVKVREWGNDSKWSKYLRPKTLFNATNFANYAGELTNSAPTTECESWE